MEAALSTVTQGPRYEAQENPSWATSLGFGLQFSMIASATLLVTPVIVANASGRGEPYVTWMVFASLVVVGISTLVQVRRLGPVGAGAVMPFFTAAFAIPFCITAVVDGGPATLTTLVLASAVFQFIISKWLFILRRLVTPVVSGTVMMILSITLASVVFGLLDDASMEEPVAAPLTALATLTVVAALTLRGSVLLRLWAPMIGIAVGVAVAAAFGIYDVTRVTQSAWVGLPSEWPGLAVEFGVPLWTLLPAFLFLGVIISIQVNGEAITHQRVARREVRAVDFREVQGALAGAGVSNTLAGLGGAVPNAVNPGIVPFIQVTGIASRRMGYAIGAIVIVRGVHPEVVRAAQQPAGAGDGGLPDPRHWHAVRGRRADGDPVGAEPAETDRRRHLLLDRRRLPVRSVHAAAAQLGVGDAGEERHHHRRFRRDY